jgi:hypothetical protein
MFYKSKSRPKGRFFFVYFVYMQPRTISLLSLFIAAGIWIAMEILSYYYPLDTYPPWGWVPYLIGIPLSLIIAMAGQIIAGVLKNKNK